MGAAGLAWCESGIDADFERAEIRLRGGASDDQVATLRGGMMLRCGSARPG